VDLLVYSAEVLFMDSTDPYEPLLHLTWDHAIDPDRARVSVDGEPMACRQTEWRIYLKAILSFEQEK